MALAIVILGALLLAAFIDTVHHLRTRKREK